MTKVVPFPKKPRARDLAIEQFSEQMAAHLAVYCYKKGFDGVPVVLIAKSMRDVMLSDGSDYDGAILSSIMKDETTLRRIEATFEKICRTHGLIS